MIDEKLLLEYVRDAAPHVYASLVHIIPIIPHVEMIRCRDCVYSDAWTHKGRTVHIVCKKLDKIIGGNDFCSWGERKDEAKE